MTGKLVQTNGLDMLKILEASMENGASDIILTSGTAPTLRIDGSLYVLGNRALSAEEVKKLAYSVLEKGQIARFETKKELDFSFTLDNKHRFRANLYMQRGAVGAVLRLIPTVIPTIDELRLPAILKKIALAPHGLFLITGATGMGKSTTLASMIGEINRNRFAHIVSVEDPIEFIHTNDKSVIDQRELGTDTLSFAEALRHVLRQSPDVIVVGEMRDLETMSAAVTAAETGHLVLATLHTRDTVKSIDRIIDSFPGPQQNQIREQIAMSLLGVMSQRLFERPNMKGRIVATEVLMNTPAVSNIIRESKTHMLRTVLETSSKQGMYTFEMNLRELVSSGYVHKSDAEAFIGKSLNLPKEY
ncbi:MAG: type IV pilus twitching motility protein PilT [Planctomycetota bacterium]